MSGFLRTCVALTAAALLAFLTGCSAGLGGPASSRSARDGVIRFTFAPDPIWDYMNETGIVDEWQRDTGYTIETSATWDEFGLFAGGHADIISSASFEVPGLEEQTQRETVIIGKYNAERSRILVRAEDPAQSLAACRTRHRNRPRIAGHVASHFRQTVTERHIALSTVARESFDRHLAARHGRGGEEVTRRRRIGLNFVDPTLIMAARDRQMRQVVALDHDPKSSHHR